MRLREHVDYAFMITTLWQELGDHLNWRYDFDLYPKTKWKL